MLDFGVKPWEMNRFRPSELDDLEQYIADEKAKADDAPRGGKR